MTSNADLIAQVADLQEELRRLEAELAASRRVEKHFRLASELASDYAFVRQVTRDGKDRLVWLNRSIFEVMGYAEGEQESEEQLFGSIHPDDLAQVQAALLQVLQGQEAESEFRFRRKDGEYIWLQTHLRPLPDATSRHLFGIVRDITRSKQAEERYRAISELAADFAYEAVLKPGGGFTLEWITGDLQRILGYEVEELNNPDELMAIVLPEDRPILQVSLAKVLAGQQPEIEFRAYRKDGSLAWISNVSRPIWDPSHQRVVGFYSSSREITRQKQADFSLRRETRRLDLLNRIAITALSGQDSHAAFRSLTETLRDFAGATDCFVTYWDEVHDLPVLLAGTGQIEEKTRTEFISPGEPSITRTILAEGRVVWVPGNDGRRVNLRLTNVFGNDKYALGLPLKVGDKKVGAAVLNFSQPHNFSAEELDLWEQIATQLSLSVTSLHLLESVQRRAVEMEKLVRVSSELRQAQTFEHIGDILLREIGLLVQADRCTLVVKRDESWAYYGKGHPSGELSLATFQGGHEYLNQVLQSGIGVFLPSATPHSLAAVHTQNDEQSSFAIIPLKSADTIIGAITISWNQRLTLAAEDFKLLTTVAEMAGNAMERALLLQTLEARIADRTHDLEILYELAALSSGPAGVQRATDLALERLIPIVGARAGAVFRVEANPLSLLVETARGLPEAAIELVDHFKPDAQSWKSLADQLSPALVRVQGTRPLLELLAQGGAERFTGYIRIPVRNKGQTLGIISLFGDQASLKLEGSSFLMAVSDLVGAAMENARLQKRSEEAAVLEERQRLARELHDSVTQSLYSLSLFSRAGREHTLQGNPQRALHYLDRLSETAQRALREMRMLLYELRQPELDRGGLVEALHQRLEVVEERVGLETAFSARLDTPLSPLVEDTLFRIALEALNNVLKHAGASKVSVTLFSDAAGALLEVEDNGCGFNASTPQSSGLGLVGIRERAQQIGAEVRLQSSLGQGSCLGIYLGQQPNRPKEEERA